MRLFFLPAKAFMLMMALGSAGIYAGIALGTWMLPIILTVAFSDVHTFSEIPVNPEGLATAPRWLDRDAGVFTSFRVAAAGLIIALLVARYFAILSDRLWRFLIIKKFHWMTPKELEEFDKHQARF